MFPEIEYITIEYCTEDIWDRGSFDPENCVQRFTGAVKGFTEEEEEIRLGKLSFSRLDLWEIEDNLLDVLDSNSSEWLSYLSLIEECQGGSHIFSSLFIFEEMTLIPEVRGHGLGLHVMARALKTWTDGAYLIVLTAGSLARDKTDAEAEAATKKLVSYWSKLSFTHFDEGILYAFSDMNKFDKTLRKYCVWEVPNG